MELDTSLDENFGLGSSASGFYKKGHSGAHYYFCCNLSLIIESYLEYGVRTLRPKTLRPRTLRPRTLRPKRTLRPNVNYAQGNYDNVISYAHIPLVP